jgi:hypothetical protein
MNEAELSSWLSCVSDPDPKMAQGPLTFFRPKRNATDHRFLLGSRLRYWLCPSLKRPELGRASKPLLRVIHSYVHIVATVTSVSRSFLPTPNFYEKASFVKPTWRPPFGERNCCSALCAMLLSAVNTL